jgi:hypothetical protein
VTGTIKIFSNLSFYKDCLCGLVVRVPGYRSKGPGSIPGRVVGLEQGPLSLVSTIEELFGRKSSESGLEIENTPVGMLH